MYLLVEDYKRSMTFDVTYGKTLFFFAASYMAKSYVQQVIELKVQITMNYMNRQVCVQVVRLMKSANAQP